jgi:hypothetical protein
MATIAELVTPETRAKLEKLRIDLKNAELKRRLSVLRAEREARRAEAALSDSESGTPRGADT